MSAVTESEPLDLPLYDMALAAFQSAAEAAERELALTEDLAQCVAIVRAFEAAEHDLATLRMRATYCGGRLFRQFVLEKRT